MPADGRKQVDDYLTKAYTGFHGDTSGLDGVEGPGEDAALPPAGFKVESVRDISLRKAQQEEEVQQEQSSCREMEGYKNALVTDPATWDQMKGAKLDNLKGTVVSSTPKRIVLALSDATTPEVTLQFETPVKADTGSSIDSTAVAKEFTKEPFMLTMTAEKGDVTGLSAAPAAEKAAPAKRAPVVVSDSTYGSAAICQSDDWPRSDYRRRAPKYYTRSPTFEDFGILQKHTGSWPEPESTRSRHHGQCSRKYQSFPAFHHHH